MHTVLCGIHTTPIVFQAVVQAARPRRLLHVSRRSELPKILKARFGCLLRFVGFAAFGQRLTAIRMTA
jgi:hypothetical protein